MQDIGKELRERLAVEFKVEIGMIRTKYNNNKGRRDERVAPTTGNTGTTSLGLDDTSTSTGDAGGASSPIIDDSSIIIVITGASEAEIKGFADMASTGSLDNVFKKTGLTIVNFTVVMDPAFPMDWGLVFSWVPILAMLLLAAMLVYWRRRRCAAKSVPVASAAVVDMKSDFVFMKADATAPADPSMSPVELRSTLSIPDLQIIDLDLNGARAAGMDARASSATPGNYEALIRSAPQLPKSPAAKKQPRSPTTKNKPSSPARQQRSFSQ